MDFSLSLEQKMLVETVREFITSELQPLEEEIEHSGKLDPDLAEDIKNKSLQLGLFSMNVPKTFGGVGLTTLDWILAEEQFGHTTDILIRRAFGNVYDILDLITNKRVDWFGVFRFGFGSHAALSHASMGKSILRLCSPQAVSMSESSKPSLRFRQMSWAMRKSLRCPKQRSMALRCESSWS